MIDTPLHHGATDKYGKTGSSITFLAILFRWNDENVTFLTTFLWKDERAVLGPVTELRGGGPILH